MTTGNAQEFGDLSQVRTYANGLSNSIRGLFGVMIHQCIGIPLIM